MFVDKLSASCGLAFLPNGLVTTGTYPTGITVEWCSLGTLLVSFCSKSAELEILPGASWVHPVKSGDVSGPQCSGCVHPCGSISSPNGYVFFFCFFKF